MVVSCISLSCSQINSLSLDDVLEINAYTVECSNSFYAVESSFDSIDVGGGAFVAAGDSFDVSTDINIKNSENKSYWGFLSYISAGEELIIGNKSSQGITDQISLDPNTLDLDGHSLSGVSKIVTTGNKDLSLPSVSGTLALTSQIPTVPSHTQYVSTAMIVEQTSGYFTAAPSFEFKSDGTISYHREPFYPSSSTVFILFYGSHRHDI